MKADEHMPILLSCWSSLASHAINAVRMELHSTTISARPSLPWLVCWKNRLCIIPCVPKLSCFRHSKVVPKIQISQLPRCYLQAPLP